MQQIRNTPASGKTAPQAASRATFAGSFAAIRVNLSMAQRSKALI
jgi:hypothetical protein